MEQLTFLIADDHPIVRGGVANVLVKHFHAEVDEAGDGDEMFRMVKKKDYALVLMDLNMPGTSPQSLLQNMLLQKPGLNVLIFSTNKPEVFGRAFLKLGAMGFLSKTSGDEELVKAVTCILNGIVYIPKNLQEMYLKGDKGKAEPNLFDGLSPKEMELVPHLVNGLSVMGIAKIMNLSPSTIGTHKANIFKKLKVETVIELKELVSINNLFGF
jgi:DNA-binding NarL/FixJ family response regulator